MPSTSANDDGIEIRVVRQEDRERVLDFMIKNFFAEEPLGYGCEPKNELIFGEDFILCNIDHDTCLMATSKDTQELVGLTMAAPKGPDEADHLLKAAAAEGNTKWGTLLRFLERVERDADVCQRYNVHKVLHINATCVDIEMRGRNIGARLYNALCELAKEKGFELLTGDCTGFYSARIKDRLGWDCVNVAMYKDYLGADNKPVFQPGPPHDCCKTYAIRP